MVAYGTAATLGTAARNVVCWTTRRRLDQQAREQEDPDEHASLPPRPRLALLKLLRPGPDVSGNSQERPAGPRLSAGTGRTGAALGRTHPANPSAVLTMLSDSGIAPRPADTLVAACHELIRRLAGHPDDLAAGPGQLPGMPQSPAHNGRSGIRVTHGSPFAIRPYSAFGSPW